MFGTEVVGEVNSIGSPEEGGDILMMGVEMGTMRGPIDSVIKVDRGRLSVLTAMCAVAMVVSRAGNTDGSSVVGDHEGGESSR